MSLGMLKARYLIDTGDWSGTVAAARVDTSQVTPPVRFALDLAAGLEAAAAGESVEARRALSRMEQRLQRSPGGERGNLEVMTLVLRAAVLHAEGRSEEALETAERAARLEAELPYEFGPPATYKPPRELRGELLLSSGRAEEAAKEFRRALERTPGRTQALLGLARAASRAGEVETAAAAYAQLAEIWKAADSALGALREEALGFARRRP
ncbi:MAG: hypothetical protein KatS3mg081_2114 [Gemmatimonadales bacterium]|nr:MAG: hypothetical protein KatS3mg081_2114 [Gemmatimonadales bacterium]